MSKYNIEAKKKTVIDGIEFKADIEKEVDIDFSLADYAVKVNDDKNETKVELIPDNMDFLYEVTEIFPLSEYDIHITQAIFSNKRHHVSLHLDIYNKETGEKAFLPESALLSDKDYEYIRDILVRELPQYEWITSEDYICDSIEQCMGEINIDEVFSYEASLLLGRMTSAKFKDLKTDGYQL